MTSGKYNLFISDRDGDVFRRSRNLSGLVRHLGSVHAGPIERIDVSRLPDHGGKLSILWSNGDSCETNFASYSVMASWIRSRRNLRGAPLSIQGAESGEVSRTNPPCAPPTRTSIS